MRWWSRLVPLIVLAAIAGTGVAFATSPEWNYQPYDDLRPPVARPAVAAAVPDDETASEIVGVALLRLRDGLPGGTAFTSSAPFFRDVRQQAMTGAWSVLWSSPDARTWVGIELVGLRGTADRTYYVQRCEPEQPESLPDPVLSAGYMFREENAAGYCLVALSKRTEVFVAVSSSDPAVVADLPQRVRSLRAIVDGALPPPVGPDATTIATPNATAQINRGLLLAVVAVPLLWSVPTLLFDRGTWQRIESLFRSRRRRLPGIDLDRKVRAGLWNAMAMATLQVCVAVWVMRLTRGWTTVPSLLAVIAGVLLVSAPPRIAHLRRSPSSRVFAGKRRMLAVAGIVLGVLLTAVALVVGFLSQSVALFGLPGLPSYIQERLTLFTTLLAIPLVLLATLPLMLFRRLAMRALRSRPDPERRTVLLLRSFADDARRVRARASYRRSIVDRLGLRRFERFEEVVAVSLNAHGEVLAVGQVGERLPPALGAVRRQFSNEEWEQRVEELMERSTIIAVTVGRSAALAEIEIPRIRDKGHLAKTIFLFPPTTRSEHIKRLAVLGFTLGIPWTELDVARPGSWVLAVMVPDPGRPPVVIRARAQEDIGYDLALELCTAAIRSDGWAGLDRTWVAEERPGWPRPEIYPAGQAPKYRPIARQLWFVNLAIVACCLPASRQLAPGSDATEFVDFADGYRPTAVAVDQSSGDLYAVVDSEYLVKLDFEAHSIEGLASFGGVAEFVVDHGIAYLAEPAAGAVVAWDVDDAENLWVARDLPGVRGLVLHDGALSAAVPGSHQVIRLDPATGEILASVEIDGIPWATTVTGDALWVSVYDRDQVLTLAPTTLAVTGRLPTPPRPGQLAAVGEQVWVYSVSGHTVTSLDGRQVIHLRNQEPTISSNGEVMAIEGIELISTVDSRSVLRRYRMPSTFADDIIVLPSGDIVAVLPGRVVLIDATKPTR